MCGAKLFRGLKKQDGGDVGDIVADDVIIGDRLRM